jgi:two-component system, cell cycle sensor histidine kinase and response regulator CckA
MTTKVPAARRARSTIADRLGLGRGASAPRATFDERAAMARASFWLFSAGATLAFASLALPGDPTRNRTGMLITIAFAYATSLVPLLGFTRLSHVSFQGLTVVGTILVSYGVYFAGANGEIYGLLYFWVVIYACYFFNRWWACFHLALVATAYAAVLQVQGEAGVMSVAWVITVGTLTIAGALILILTGRLAQVLRELTESESESRERGTRLQAVIQSAPVAIIEVGPDANVRTWNGEAERLFGWKAEEVYGRPSPVNFERSVSDPRQPDLLGESALQDASVQHPRGGFQRVAFKSAAVLSEDGGQVGTIDLAIDVTERRRLEEQLRRAQNMEAVGRLGGAVAHDFNNILLAIRSYAWLLADSIEGDGRHRECLAEIEKAVDRATVLTRQLLAFSQRQTEAPSVTDLNELVHEVTGMLRPLIGGSVDLVIKPAQHDAPVLANVTQLEQVVVNLAMNARQAMPDGGTLLIEVLTPTPAAGGASLSSEPGPEVILRVSDTGAGLDADQRQLVFQPFYTTRKDEGGTGLGLSTVYGIVTSSGGSIDVSSKPGLGATFTIRFPRAQQRRRSAPQVAAATSLSGSETVLLVEDDDSVRVPLQRSLEQYGYSVLSAADGEAALEVAATFPDPIELVITDIVMPMMGGEELVDRLLEARPSTRVIYVSGYVGSVLGLVTEDSVEPVPVTPFRAANRDGAVFLQKPFTVEQLATSMRQLLDPPLAA